MDFREIDIVRVFDAPRELVWAAWTDPDQLAAWWGPSGMTTPRESVEMDVRPGGVFRLTMVAPDGTEFPTDMRFTVVEPVATLGYEWDGQRGIGGGTATVTLKDLSDGRTELTNHFAGYTDDVVQGYMIEGTNQQFDKLAAFIKQ
ncbi:SRPBCC family protein [Winogradskya consettensis]|uniref:Activator of HSP90 ATPase n=1 Tax=Winogradskya consettensis TaxID=113560 RepID=A0A919T1Y4_9ACTN|nr:SRPBCC domain-containing protein [Actinoplanes consettensis]GIM83931.1 activator of HSP90 ATPase [Actinoplanes consettensis]